MNVPGILRVALRPCLLAVPAVLVVALAYLPAQAQVAVRHKG